MKQPNTMVPPRRSETPPVSIPNPNQANAITANEVPRGPSKTCSIHVTAATALAG